MSLAEMSKDEVYQRNRSHLARGKLEAIMIDAVNALVRFMGCAVRLCGLLEATA